VESGEYASIAPLSVGTIAMFDVVTPSVAFRVDASGCARIEGQRVRNCTGAKGTTVAFST
jgi:hypothetical protein